ncbi:UvrD-helicase domain-containing protein [Nocardia sp. CA-129566]|uniref:ATP-dependent helicase n=1 Tax=Nocardia sp. CA-129566 TaxID=3239976 RepID=UPI003D99B0F2
MSGTVSPNRLAEALGLPPPTDEQAAVIAAPPGPTLVVAGAGAGKTETMAARVVWMVANRLVLPDEVLGLTFTRKAAQQLTSRIRTRLARLAGSPLLRELDTGGELRTQLSGAEPEISTYHSYAGRLLTQHGLLLPVEPSATLLTETQLWQLAHQVVRNWDGDLDTERTPVSVTEAVLALSGQLAEHLVEPEQLAEAHTELEKLVHTLPAGPRQRGGPSQALQNIVQVQRERVALLPLVKQLAEALRRRGALDFGAQMSLAARLAAEHPEVAAAERARFRLVLLDEYQDTGHAQRILLAALFGGSPPQPHTKRSRKATAPSKSTADTGPDRPSSSGAPIDRDVRPGGPGSDGGEFDAGVGGSGSHRSVPDAGVGGSGSHRSVPDAGVGGSGSHRSVPDAGVGGSGSHRSVPDAGGSGSGSHRADPDVRRSEDGEMRGHRSETEQRATSRGEQRLAVTAVGDPMQSIYGWRGASAANLPRFATDFPSAPGVPAPILPLLTSWRNPPEALALANLVAEPLRRNAIDSGGVTVDALRAKPDAAPGVVAMALTETVADERDWVAGRIAAEWSTKRAAGAAPPTSAVLVRRNADAAPLAEALREQGLPVEIVGLGGLLATPEVADIVATLRLIAEPGAGSAAMRILTGARWRIGVADLAALARRARDLSISRLHGNEVDEITDSTALAEALREVAPEPAEQAGLADAIADPGPREQYSESGFLRIVALGRELAALRERSGQPLAELVADVERTIGVGVETQARRAMVGAGAGREHLDAFAEVVAGYASDSGASLGGLLAFLAAAESVENGLEPGEVEVARDRVQVLTVHAAKGLEWEIVAVPHVTRGVFPSGAASGTWLGALAELPTALRGDRQQDDAAEGVPVLDLSDLYDRADLERAIKSHKESLDRRRIDEDRRLFYVALTRTERVLLVAAHHWAETGTAPKGPSDFLLELKHASEAPDSPAHGAVTIDRWDDAPDVDAVNPFTDNPATAEWPRDPLGNRRDPIERGASLVRAALAELAAQPAAGVTATNRTVQPATRDKATASADFADRVPHDIDMAPTVAPATDNFADPKTTAAGRAAVVLSADPYSDVPPPDFPDAPAPFDDPYEPPASAPGALDRHSQDEFPLPPPDFEPHPDMSEPPLSEFEPPFDDYERPFGEFEPPPDEFGSSTSEPTPPHDHSAGHADDPEDPDGWAADVDALLAEFEADQAITEEVELPGQIAATALVEMRADPAELAARLRRPLPFPPNPLARRGTAFHAWVQRWFAADRLLGFDELPGADSGAADAGVDTELVAMQESFLNSPWAHRSPLEVEIPFETSIAGTVIRGRMDAVFAEPGGGWIVVDWKTGAEPAPADEPAVAMQLAVYRLAWARLMAARDHGTEAEMLERIGAAFHYVRTGRTIAPAALPGPDELAELIRNAAPNDPRP